MYLGFYGLKREPFHISPDPYFFYFAPTHKEAYAALVYAIRNRKGFVAITGEVGLGKTTIIRTFLNHFKSQHKLKIVLIFNTKLSFKNILKLILLDLGFDKKQILEIENRAHDEESFEVEAVELLYDYLIEQYKRGINVVLILDEAQNLPIITLEKLRLISNLETDKNKLIQIVLIGQPELDKKLSQKSLRQLRQRIELKIKLKELNKKEVEKYIAYRLKKAGYSGENIFTKSAIKKIYKYSKGIPRKINIICDNALITGFAKDKRKIGPKIIKEVCKELYSDERNTKSNKLFYGVIFCVMFLMSFYFGTHFSNIDLSFLSNLNSYREQIKKKNFQEKKDILLSKSTKKSIENPKILQHGNPHTNRHTDNISQIIGAKVKTERTVMTNSKNSSTNKTTIKIDDKDSYSKSPDRPNRSQMKKNKISGSYNIIEKKEQTSASIIFKNNLIQKLDTSGKIIYLILQERIPFFNDLSDVRQIVLVEMAKQTSIPGLFSFKKMLSALKQKNYELAARHMLYSNWFARVGEKAVILAEIMKNNDKTALIKWLDKNYPAVNKDR
ncbi:hypothetical protein JCM12298_16060 [Desulfothermus naphthae]